MYLIAIDGQRLSTAEDPYKYLQNKADSVVTLMYNDKPTPDGAKEYRVKTTGGESGIRYREWVEKNRKYVEEKTNGQVGYLHIPDMGEGGVREFAKAWHWQTLQEGHRPRRTLQRRRPYRRHDHRPAGAQGLGGHAAARGQAADDAGALLLGLVLRAD